MNSLLGASSRGCIIRRKWLIFGMLVLTYLVWVFPAAADDVDLGFVEGIGGVGADFGIGIAMDSSGNVYTTGYFSDTVDFDPGAGTSVLVSMGDFDLFVSKHDSSGNFLWAVGIGGTLEDQGRSVAVDSAGNVYVTGFFNGTVDFDPGSGIEILTSLGDTDIFVLKLDTDGNFIWANSMGSATEDEGRSIAVDDSGNSHVTGYFNDTVDFDADVGVFNITSAGSRDLFVLKLNTDGEFVWARAMGGTSFEAARSIAVDRFGNVFTTGYFTGTADFDPGGGTTDLVSMGELEIFVSKLNSDGNFLWAKAIGGVGSDYGYGIASDSLGNVHVAGYFTGPVDFDPGSGMANLVSVGSGDIFVCKLDGAGDFLWANSMGGMDFDTAYGIAVDAFGNVYTTGVFQGMVDFDPGAGAVELADGGIFVQKLDSDGMLVYAKGMGSVAGHVGRGIVANAEGNVYVTGYFNTMVDFDPNAGVFSLTSAGLVDIFLLKLIQVSGGGSGNCLIANLSYGTPLAQELDSIRAFRDQSLLTNPAGSLIAGLYYRVSPSAVGWVSSNEERGLGAKGNSALLLALFGILILAVRRRGRDG